MPIEEDIADLKAGPSEGVPKTDREGVVPTSREEVEEQVGVLCGFGSLSS